MAASKITETRTYLSFSLDEEDFAVDVSNVREVLDYTSITKVPRTPDFMKGVINLRGGVVPVVDMRLKFGMSEAETTVDTCIVVMEVELEGESTVIGALADSVREVFELDPAEIEPAPRLGTRLDTEFISGMGKHNENFIIILDVNQVFSAEELILFRKANEAEPAKIAGKQKGRSKKESGEKEDTAGTEDAVAEEEGGTVHKKAASKSAVKKAERPKARKKTG